MPYTSPSVGSVHVNRPLTNISIAYMQSEDAFVANRVFPSVPVASKSDSYYVFDRGDFNRLEMESRAPATESAGGGFRLSNDTYLTDVKAYHKDVDDQARANQDSPVGLDTSATRMAARQGLLRQEVDFQSKYMVASAWTFGATGATTRASAFDPTVSANRGLVYWDGASSTPIEDVRMLKRAVLSETGFTPNVLTIGRVAFDTLLDHGDIVGRLDRGQTTGPAMVKRDALAALFELDEVLVMDAIQNTAAEGVTSSGSFINGKNALLSYRTSSPGLMEPTAGYTFVWTGYLGSVENGIEITRFRMEHLKATRIEAEVAYDQKVVGVDLGVYLAGIVQ